MQDISSIFFTDIIETSDVLIAGVRSIKAHEFLRRQRAKGPAGPDE